MKITQPSGLILTFRSWHAGISDQELYVVMRVGWKIGKHPRKACDDVCIGGGRRCVSVFSRREQ